MVKYHIPLIFNFLYVIHASDIMMKIKQNKRKDNLSMAVAKRIHSSFVAFFPGAIIFSRSQSSKLLDVGLEVEISPPRLSLNS